MATLSLSVSHGLSLVHACWVRGEIERKEEAEKSEGEGGREDEIEHVCGRKVKRSLMSLVGTLTLSRGPNLMIRP